MCMKMGKMCPVHKTAFVLVFVGALNWGLVGAFGWNLVTALLGNWPMAVRVVYILVGLSALMMLMMGKCKMCRMHGCGEGGCGCGTEEKKM